MIGHLYPLLLSTVTAALLLSACGESGNSSADNVAAVPDAGTLLPYSVLMDNLADGANPGETFGIRNGGFGSAAAADPTNKNRFYAMTDRGPNATYSGAEGKGKIFPTPDYTPRIGLFEVGADGNVTMVKEILFKDTAGQPISGLPNSAALGGTGEIPYDTDGNAIRDENGSIKTDDFGLDSEGLAVMEDGTYWVSDEYGPHMVHFDKNGKEIGRINPFAGDSRNTYTLPAEFGRRWANRGMEGLTVTPDQKSLVGIMQSTLDNPSSAVRGTLTRIVTVSLEDGTVKQYLYKQEKAKNSNSEITALSNDVFLVIERDGSFYKDTTAGQKHVYKIKLTTGTELESIAPDANLTQDADGGLLLDGQTLEEVAIQADGWETLAAKGIVPVQKELVVDMIKAVQYPHDKMEGLIVFDEHTLGIVNDDDFAMWATGGVLEQKYLDAAKTKIDGNTLYVVHDLELSGMTLHKLASYNTGKEGGSEISAYDSASKRLFITNGADNRLDIVSVADVAAPALVTSVDLSAYGAGVQSVSTKKGKVAVAVGSADKVGTVGKVLLFDTDGGFLAQTRVGYLPDMVTFTGDGKKILVANEGEPDASGGSYADAKGSVGLITVAQTTAADDATGYAEADFSAAALSAAADGTPVRLGGTPKNDKAFDIEPEYITVSGSDAYVTLQENNAVAKVDISGATPTLTWVKSLGAKSYEPGSGNTIDIEEEGNITMKSYPGLFGLYMPDTIASYTAGGETYFVTANEGDGREWCNGDESYCFVDEEKIKKLSLDPAIADAYANENDLKVVTDMGDSDSDDVYEKLYAYGARSFSIWSSSGDLVFDSGDAISKKIAEIEPALFNQDDGEMDGRSGNKGGEPEALALGSIGGKTYAFVGLERQSAILIYDISDPMQPVYVDYVVTHTEGDVSPEGMLFVPADQSPNGKNLLIVSNEVSGSTVLYEITQ
ncbi:choice-of-anchor I family protein [Sulfurimonas sp. ST-25]|uniref:choice-of-anchor I family protein n=1 Tax=Sulfurimonas sp. ST-25 TaxID=3400151 RepID=UPI003A8B8EFC